MPSNSSNTATSTVLDPSGMLIATEVTGVVGDTATQVTNVVSRNDVEGAGEGDVFVSSSGSRRTVLEKNGLKFRFLTSRSFEGDQQTDYRFSLRPEGNPLESADLYVLPTGITLYERTKKAPVILREIKKVSGKGGGPYGVVVEIEETMDIDLDTFGKWLVAIEKKKGQV